MTGAVHIDLKKAFNTVDHYILLQNISLFGIENSKPNHFKNYLHNDLE